MKTAIQLEERLRHMREEAVEYSCDPEHVPEELLRRKGECANLWGAIECLKKGTTPVLASQAKWLE
jgi:hypothetical protein